jgi:hypothetical protein
VLRRIRRIAGWIGASGAEFSTATGNRNVGGPEKSAQIHLPGLREPLVVLTEATASRIVKSLRTRVNEA